MAAVAIVVLLALLEYLFFGLRVGAARAKYGVKAPAVTGDPAFERYFRIHQNTLENLVVFIPAIWLFGLYISPIWAAGIGLDLTDAEKIGWWRLTFSLDPVANFGDPAVHVDRNARIVALDASDAQAVLDPGGFATSVEIEVAP